MIWVWNNDIQEIEFETMDRLEIILTEKKTYSISVEIVTCNRFLRRGDAIAIEREANGLHKHYVLFLRRQDAYQ